MFNFKFLKKDNDLRKKILFLSVLLLILTATELLLLTLSKRTSFQNKATGSGQIKFTLNTAGGWTIPVNGTKTIDINVTNSGGSAMIFSFGTEIRFNTNHFSASSVSCNAEGPVQLAPAENTISGNSIKLVCFKVNGLALAGGSTIKIGSFILRANNNSGLVGQSSSLEFTRTLIPNGNGGDWSDSGTNRQMTITPGGGPTDTPTPTVTLPPGVTPSATPTPSGKINFSKGWNSLVLGAKAADLTYNDLPEACSYVVYNKDGWFYSFVRDYSTPERFVSDREYWVYCTENTNF